MSDRPIQVGDLVMVVRVRPCCPELTGWGRIFRVSEITGSNGTWRCHKCGNITPRIPAAWSETPLGAELYRLKRIPPLSELEGERPEEQLKEPA